ncbi:unnamed protein product [Dicrocoelium dendriticum]|nr:unnamed protein product [Dicrocoelium dendriticum]
MITTGLRYLRRFSSVSFQSPSLTEITVTSDQHEEYFKSLLREIASPTHTPLPEAVSATEIAPEDILESQKPLPHRHKRKKNKNVELKSLTHFATKTSDVQRISHTRRTTYKPKISDLTLGPISSAPLYPPTISPDQSICDSIVTLREWFSNLDLNSLSPTLHPAGNLAAYVPRSHTLTQLVLLGVDLSKIESIPGVANMLVKLDFRTAVEPLIWKLNGYGFSLKAVARLFTGYPKILQLPSDELDNRLNYFLSHGFKQPVVVEMVTRYPTVLQMAVIEVDRQLGDVQSVFQFSADELRGCVASTPKIILHPLSKIKDVYVILTKMIGFSTPVTRSMVCSHPKLLVTGELPLFPH